MMTDKSKYAPGILAALKLRGWTRHRLAVELSQETGVYRPATVYAWCSGKMQPTAESLFAIGRALAMSTTITPEGVEYVEPEETREFTRPQ